MLTLLSATLALAALTLIAFAVQLHTARATTKAQRARLEGVAAARSFVKILAAPTASEMVTEFHQLYDQPIRLTPTLDVPETLLRLALIREEVGELERAVAAGDIVETLDALADIEYVVHGAALTWGLPLDEAIAEVHRSNLTKLGEDGKPIYGDGVSAPVGKVLKGPNYERPKIAAVLATAPAYRTNRAEAAAAALHALDFATEEQDA